MDSKKKAQERVALAQAYASALVARTQLQFAAPSTGKINDNAYVVARFGDGSGPAIWIEIDDAFVEDYGVALETLAYVLNERIGEIIFKARLAAEARERDAYAAMNEVVDDVP